MPHQTVLHDQMKNKSERFLLARLRSQRPPACLRDPGANGGISEVCTSPMYADEASLRTTYTFTSGREPGLPTAHQLLDTLVLFADVSKTITKVCNII